MGRPIDVSGSFQCVNLSIRQSVFPPPPAATFRSCTFFSPSFTDTGMEALTMAARNSGSYQSPGSTSVTAVIR